jgi:protein O-mannosyl-transferase
MVIGQVGSIPRRAKTKVSDLTGPLNNQNGPVTKVRKSDCWNSKHGRWILFAILIIVTLLLYLQVAGYQFLYYDDNRYVTENAMVREGFSWDGVRWAFTSLDVANWHPLTWLSHMLDVQLFGLNPGAHHLVNVLFHAANAGLLFLALAAMTGAPVRSAFVTALFAIHPLHTESVAWIAERKDVLSTFFGLLMLWAYIRHTKQPGSRRFILVVLCFVMSLLSKPMWVTAPFLFFLFDYWPLQRVEGSPIGTDSACPVVPHLPLKRLITEKIPLLALSFLSSTMAMLAQNREGALVPTETIDFGARLSNAVVSYARYLGKTFWPASLSIFYPYPENGLPALAIAGAGALLVAITTFVLIRLYKSPWLALGWFWFLGTLLPVIGLVQVGAQAMADRYSYLPIVGIFIAVTWEVGHLALKWPLIVRRALALGAFAVMVALSVLTWEQAGYWSDQEVLTRHALAVTENNWRAHLMLSQSLAEKRRFHEALSHAAEAVRLIPTYARAHNNLGFLLYRVGRVDEAIIEFQRAIALQPDNAEAHGNLGIAFGKKGWTEDARKEMSLAARLRSMQRKR